MKKYFHKPNLYLLVIGILCFSWDIILIQRSKNQPPQETQHEIQSEIPDATLEFTENMNSIITVDSVNSNLYILSARGDYIPDIMSEKIMKSDMRKYTKSINGNQRDIYMSGPKICINDYPVPEHCFYMEGDYYGDECYYVINSKCLRNAGLKSNSDTRVTVYDSALLNAADDYTVLVDELELHSTWEIDRYDEATNTYYFTVTQNGPFSGTSNIFSTYIHGDRMNAFPIEGSIHGTRFISHDSENKYWETTGLNRDDFRLQIDKKYNTHYGRLSYEQALD